MCVCVWWWWGGGGLSLAGAASATGIIFVTTQVLSRQNTPFVMTKVWLLRHNTVGAKYFCRNRYLL